MSIFLDLLIASTLGTPSLFFLNVLNQKNLYYILFIGLVIDFIIAGTNGVISAILLFLYLINKNYNNYFFCNLFNYFFTLIILGLGFSIVSFLLQCIFIFLTKKHIINW